LECLRQNEEFLASERDDLLSARDHIKIEKIRSHIDMLLKQRETIKASLAELTTSAVVEPQLKRHITQVNRESTIKICQNMEMEMKNILLGRI
jgi:uncharacterized protein YjgD (DUF1641 family)